jgi:hypothetical protein
MENPLNKMTDKRIRNIILIMLICFSVNGLAGENRSRHFHIGGGWAYSGLRDHGLSPLYYAGNHALISTGVPDEE